MELDLDGEKGMHISCLDEEDESQIGENKEVNPYDDDEDEDDDEETLVTLGFAEKPKHAWSLLRQYFPSKAGGSPAWLDPINLPSRNSGLCDFCGQPLQFLLQVYAPLSEKSAFHRILFIFICPSMACLLRDQHEQWKRPPVKPSRSVTVFRCQLPRENPFYSSEAPKDDGTEQALETGAPLCNWCGTWRGDKICSKCKQARYCSQEHQAAHWRSGHNLGCVQVKKSCNSSKPAASNSLWPEYEIINEDEPELETDDANANALISSGMDENFGSLPDNSEDDADKRSWATFAERISRAPEQILRYSRDAKAKPLWPMSSGRPSKYDIPKCSYCHGTRCFEFQVLPQLLHYMGVNNDADSLDWATIAVYTCEDSCEENVPYKEEFAFVQLQSQSPASFR